MISEHYSLLLTFDDLPDLQADVMQKWARSKYRKMWRERVYWAVRQATGIPPEPLEYASIHCIRQSAQVPDRANLAYSFKPILDALIKGKGKANVLVDDEPQVLLHEHYSWMLCSPHKGRIIVRVVGEPKPVLTRCVTVHLDSTDR